MKNREYTEQGLSGDYFRVINRRGPLHRPSQTYVVIARIISENEKEIRNAYDHDKNLNKVSIKDFGPKTKKVLELILDKGVEGALKILSTKKVEKLEDGHYQIAPEVSHSIFRPVLEKWGNPYFGKRRRSQKEVW